MTKINGQYLITLGYTPSKWFGEIIDEVNTSDLDGQKLLDFIEESHKKYLEKNQKIDLHEVPVKYHKNIEGNTEDEKNNVQRVFDYMDILMKTPVIEKGAVMPDACPAGGLGSIPVGGVVASRNAIHPRMHSADICCSVMMTNLGNFDPELVLDSAMENTHFGPVPKSRKSKGKLPKSLKEEILSNDFLKNKGIFRHAEHQLGTQGDGNHFLFVGTSENTGETILVTHHGSRAFGAGLYKAGMREAERLRKKLSPDTIKSNAWIPYETEVGKSYWEALQIVRKWTKLNHETVHDLILRDLGIYKKDRFWNEHNFVFKDGKLFYHAKGATPLLDKFVPDSRDGKRLIPLSMAQPILVVNGELTENNLGFAPHGAGRNVSRTQHRKSFEGKTDEEIFQLETDGIDARFYSGNIDITELPSAYKDAEEVQRQIEKFQLGNIVDRIMPYGSIMAGNWQKNLKKRKK